MVRPITRDIARVRAEAQVLHRGRTQATAQANLVDAETGKLLASGTSTCLILGDG
jgi:acyl-coenzyme A thioesterase PaaI-like protein